MEFFSTHDKKQQLSLLYHGISVSSQMPLTDFHFLAAQRLRGWCQGGVSLRGLQMVPSHRILRGSFLVCRDRELLWPFLRTCKDIQAPALDPGLITFFETSSPSPACVRASACGFDREERTQTVRPNHPPLRFWFISETSALLMPVCVVRFVSPSKSLVKSSHCSGGVQ